MALANSSYDRLPALADEPGVVNLAWTLDEREFLDADLPALVAAEMAAEVESGLPYVNSYFVRDPHGETELGPVVERFFDREGWSCGVLCGAGVISLLHAVSVLALAGPVYVAGEVYPDLPHWIGALGGRCVSSARHVDGIRSTRPALVLVDRPSSVDTEFEDLEALRELCVVTAEHGGVVVVDESYANYCSPDYSAATIAQELENLVVLRGLSKGYWLGGLRLAYCVTSPAVSGRIRAVVPPMLASSLSLRLGKSVLALGDITSRLRGRISVAKREMTDLLADVGLPLPAEGGAFVPHLLFDEGDAAAEIANHCESRGVLGKPQPFWHGAQARTVQRYRLSVPLRPDRMRALRRHLSPGSLRHEMST